MKVHLTKITSFTLSLLVFLLLLALLSSCRNPSPSRGSLPAGELSARAFFGTAPSRTFYTDKSTLGITREEGLNPNPVLETTMVTTDSMGGIGPNYIVQMVNFRIAIYDRRSPQLTRVREASLKEFFAIGNLFPEGDNVGDPRVIYDHTSSRWFACGMDRSTNRRNNRILLAVSTDSDPVPLNTPANLSDRTWIAAKWKKYYLRGNETNLLNDYPTMGLDRNGLYISTVFDDYLNSAGISMHKVVAIPIAPLVNGSTALEQPVDPANVFVFPSTGGVIQPALNFDFRPRDNVAWFITKTTATTNVTSNLATNQYRPGGFLYGKLKWTGTRFEKQGNWFDPNNALPVPSTLSYWDIPASGVNFFAPQPQKSPTSFNLARGGGTHIYSAVMRNNRLWICQHVGFERSGNYTGSGSLPDRSGIVWFQFQVNGNSNPTLAHTTPNPTYGRIWDNIGTYRTRQWFYYPTLAVNRVGDLLLGFSGSSPNHFVSAYYKGWSAAGPHPTVLMQSGRDAFAAGGSTRWADYSATAVDPNDTQSFCTFQPYAETLPTGPEELEPSPPRWGTSIHIVKVK